MTVRGIRWGLAAAAAGLVLAGCGNVTSTEEPGTASASSGGTSMAPPTASSSPAAETPSPIASSSFSSPVQTSAGPAAVGTRENPVPLGSPIRIGDWEVLVTAVTTNVVREILAENQFNERPAKGETFVLWGVNAKYVGEESGDPMIDLSWKAVGSAGNTFDDSCGVIPKPLNDAGEAFPGAVVTGLVCVRMPKNQIKGGAIIATSTFSLGDERAFFALR